MDCFLKYDILQNSDNSCMRHLTQRFGMEMHVNDISTKTTLCCYTIANGSFRDVVFIITTINIMSRKQKLDSIILKSSLMYVLQSF